ncbi:MAG: terminase large subunit domain-containing protein, partial [Candidatus Hinthialibacter sp.]
MPDADFLRQQTEASKIFITRITQRLMREDGETDLLDPKVQSLHRLRGRSIHEYISLCERLEKPQSENKAQKKTPPGPPPVPDSWKADPAVFARDALNLELYDHQKKLCCSRKRVNLLVAGRGAGKSLAACVAAVHQAIVHDRRTVLVVSSGQRMSSDFGAKIADLIRESPAYEFVASISNEQIVFKNRSAVKLLPANPDTIRGYHPKTHQQNAGATVILDEACFMEQGDEIRKAVEYALITTSNEQGRLYIVTSPSSTGSWVYDYVQKAGQDGGDIELIQCPSAANPNIPAEEIERLRRSKNELEFRAEVLGEWVDGAFGLYRGFIEKCIVKSGGAPIPPHAAYALGADLALSYSANSDRNALAVIARWTDEDDELRESRYRLVQLQILEHASDRELRRAVRDLAQQYPLEYAAIEQYQGKGLSEYCQSLGVETQLTAAGPGQQQMIFHELHRLLRNNLLQLPGDLPEIFFDELKAFEYHRGPD